MRWILFSALLLLAAPALAEPPAAIPDAGRSRAEASFNDFARDWMAKVQRLEEKARRNPTVQTGASSPMTTYRGYGDDYSVELRPTGHAAAPYVGLLRYSELVYTCADAASQDCSVASVVPVTEIFRYQNGRWSY